MSESGGKKQQIKEAESRSWTQKAKDKTIKSPDKQKEEEGLAWANGVS